MKAKLGLCLVAAVFAGCSLAESAAPPVTDTLSWNMPTQYTDGSVLALADISKTTVVWGSQPGGPYDNTQDVPAPAVSVVLTRPGTGYGTRCYKVNVTAKGVPGLYSAEGCKTVQAPPNAPTNLQVQ